MEAAQGLAQATDHLIAATQSLMLRFGTGLVN